LEVPDRGTIEIGDLKVNVERISKKEIIGLRKETAMVFQNYNLFKNKTAIENIMESLVAVQQMPVQEAKQVALSILKQIGLV